MERDQMMRRIRLEEESKDFMCSPHEEGIAANVFSRLPFATVFGCLGVKKSWFHMLKRVITRPDFAQNHLDNILKEEGGADAATGYLLLIQKRDNSLYLEMYFAEYVREYSYKVSHLSCPPKWPFDVLSMDYKKIVGSCNGLICLSKRISHKTVDFDPIYIYNPILKEYLNLPPISNYLNKYKLNEEPTMASGFGFYTTNKNVKKYKVVRIYYKAAVGGGGGGGGGGGDVGGGGEVQIYTLGEGMWKTMGEKIQYQLQSKEPGVLLNGSLHWLIEKKDEPVMIVAFNLSTELFNVVQPPDDLPIYDSDTWTQFMEFEGKLSLAHVTEGHIKFWILVDATWIKKQLTLTTGEEFAYFTPYAFRKNLDEVLLSCTTENTEEVLSFYHFENDALVEVMRMEGNREQDVVPHTNSFLSLKAMGEDGKKMMTNDRN